MHTMHSIALATNLNFVSGENDRDHERRGKGPKGQVRRQKESFAPVDQTRVVLVTHTHSACPRPVFEGNRAKVETSRSKEAGEKNLRIHVRLSMIMMICVSPEGKEKVGTLTGGARIRQRALLASMCDGTVNSRCDCFDFS